VLDLARTHPFARRIVNSGRLSVPAVLRDSPLNTPDRDAFSSPMAPGAVALDAPLGRDGEDGWLLRHLGPHFTALLFDGPDTDAKASRLAQGAEGIASLIVLVLPSDGVAAERYDARPGTAYLIRPDQHVSARWRDASAPDVAAALKRALAEQENDR